ncbi:MAG: hypothetical protein SWQ30_19185 [Thermodesulfobacteriota bacterium]|nr:hypothetical protein [Thermodesulfobacteriota bacterium]
MRKFRPTYWVCLTGSEDERYTSYVQLALHIGKVDVYAEESLNDVRRHLAIKVFIYRDMDDVRLAPFIHRLSSSTGRDKFKQILVDLNTGRNKENQRYFFFETGSHFNERAKYDPVEDIDHIIRLFQTYNNPSKRLRSVEFTRHLDWEDRSIRDKLKKKKKAIDLITGEIQCLLPLYYFITGQDIKDNRKKEEAAHK